MKKTSTRDKLIHAMADALQRKGLHGVGLNELLEVAGAPKGSLYHHFPGGKSELAVAAIEHISQHIDSLFEQLFAQQADPLQAHGHSDEQADNLAALFVALYEGGLLQARVAGSSEPLKRAAAALFNLTRTPLAQGACS